MHDRAKVNQRASPDLRDTDRPVALPHLEDGSGIVRFLGEPLDSGVFPPNSLGLWRECVGIRAVDSWERSDQDILVQWHQSGLLVGAPSPRDAAPATLTVVSPHPDDAQLALGGMLSMVGGRVLDIFSEETWTHRPYYQARPELTRHLLVAEERIACQVLDLELDLLGHVDAASRGAWRDGFFVADLSGRATVEAEPHLFAVLLADLRMTLPESGPILGPLAIGGHVDHLLVREALAALVDDGSLDPARLLFYEDMPYAFFSAAHGLVANWTPPGALGVLRPTPLSIPACDALAKRESLRTYRLQVTAGTINRVLRYGSGRPGIGAFVETLWVPDAFVPLPDMAWLA